MSSSYQVARKVKQCEKAERSQDTAFYPRDGVGVQIEDANLTGIKG